MANPNRAQFTKCASYAIPSTTPEKVKVAKDMLSDYCKKIADKFNISSGLVHKLIPTLNDKEKYILHYRNLQSYLSLGLKLKKIHKSIRIRPVSMA